MRRLALAPFFWAMAVPAALLPNGAAAQELEPGVRDLIREAFATERPTVINVLKRLHPDMVDEIDQLVSEIDEEKRAEARRGKLTSGLRAELAAGGYRSTGNSDEWGLNGEVALERRGLAWSQNLDLSVETKTKDGERTDERLFGEFRLRRDFGDSNWFAVGGLRYERDRFQGLGSRFGQFAGPGYQILDGENATWEVSGGPGFRQTRFIDAPNSNQFGAFARTDFTWRATDTLTFRQKLNAGIAKGSDSYTSTTSLTTNVYGSLSFRLSFVAELETQPPPGREELETYTRASLVFNFDP